MSSAAAVKTSAAISRKSRFCNDLFPFFGCRAIAPLASYGSRYRGLSPAKVISVRLNGPSAGYFSD